MRSLDFIADCTHKIAGVIDELKRNEQLKSPHYDKVLSIYRKTLESMLDRQPLSRQEIMDFNEELDRLDYYLQLMRRRCIDACNPNNGRAYPTYVKAKKIVTSTRPLTADRKELFKATLKVCYICLSYLILLTLLNAYEVNFYFRSWMIY